MSSNWKLDPSLGRDYMQELERWFKGAEGACQTATTELTSLVVLAQKLYARLHGGPLTPKTKAEQYAMFGEIMGIREQVGEVLRLLELSQTALRDLELKLFQDARPLSGLPTHSPLPEDT